MREMVTCRCVDAGDYGTGVEAAAEALLQQAKHRSMCSMRSR